MTTSIVIFGASGDLTARKLIPALYNLFLKDRLPHDFLIVGVARRPYSPDDFRALLRDSTPGFVAGFDAERWAAFEQRVWYVRADVDTPADYAALDAFLRDKEDDLPHRLYYLSVSPAHYATIAAQLGAHDMAREVTGWRRLIVEKPFGYDLPSARQLNHDLHAVFDEHQIYRIDHYLGKETAQNILFLRFANAIFEPVWNRNYVDSVLITVAEQVDVGHRAGYYDTSGVLRDMFQNHLLQLFTLAAMEPPSSFSADALRNEKVKALNSVRPIALHDTVRGQYEGYRDAPGVAPGSQTATFAQLALYVDNWRWKGVPFYLRCGKALREKASEVTIRFQRPPHLMFALPSERDFTPNVLAICIQPDEGIHLRFEAKVPGGGQQMSSVDMEFHYNTSFAGVPIPDAYERLLLDALFGDAALFTRSDEIEAAWRLIDPLIHGWTLPDAPPLSIYPRASWGPPEADEALRAAGRHWRLYCLHDA